MCQNAATLSTRRKNDWLEVLLVRATMLPSCSSPPPLGLVGAVTLPVSGAFVCCVQVVRGCVNTPSAVVNYSKGKVWDQEQRRWVPKPGSALVVAGASGVTSGLCRSLAPATLLPPSMLISACGTAERD